MFYFLDSISLSNLYNNHPKDVFVTINNEIIGTRHLIDSISQSIESPYQHDNWDGLEEALRDLSWLPDRSVRILNFSLPVLSKVDTDIYLSILKSLDTIWDHYNSSLYSGLQCAGLYIYFDNSLKCLLNPIV